MCHLNINKKTWFIQLPHPSLIQISRERRRKKLTRCPDLRTTNFQPESSQVLLKQRGWFSAARIFVEAWISAYKWLVENMSRMVSRQHCPWHQDSQSSLISMPDAAAKFSYTCVQILSPLPSFDNNDCETMKLISSKVFIQMRANLVCAAQFFFDNNDLWNDEAHQQLARTKSFFLLWRLPFPGGYRQYGRRRRFRLSC